jgi:hypothetical protein
MDDAKVAAVPDAVPPNRRLEALEEPKEALFLEYLQNRVRRVLVLASLQKRSRG